MEDIMIFGLACLLAFFIAKVCPRWKIPPLLAMLLVGLGISENTLLSFGIKPLSESITHAFSPFRTLALGLILWRAALGIDLKFITQKRTEIFSLSLFPCLLEGLGIAAISYWVFDWPMAYALVLGFIFSAVSPAVIVPAMLRLTKKFPQPPSLILATCALDDVFAITFFVFSMELLLTQEFYWLSLVMLPMKIGLGFLAGYFVAQYFSKSKIILWFLFISSFALLFWESNYFSPLCYLLSLGIFLKKQQHQLENSFGLTLKKIWIYGEVILFVAIGSQINIGSMPQFLSGVFLISAALAIRSIAVWFCMRNERKEFKYFAMISLLPKATVQAAIGGLLVGYANTYDFIDKNIASDILNYSVIAILISAPLGAILIEKYGYSLLKQNETK